MSQQTPEPTGDEANPLTHPEVMGGRPGTMDPAKTTHPDAVEQEYNFGANTRSQQTADLNKP